MMMRYKLLSNKAKPLTFNCMSALSEKLKVPRPIKQLSAARKSLDFLSRASGRVDLFINYLLSSTFLF